MLTISFKILKILNTADGNDFMFSLGINQLLRWEMCRLTQNSSRIHNTLWSVLGSVWVKLGVEFFSSLSIFADPGFRHLHFDFFLWFILISFIFSTVMYLTIFFSLYIFFFHIIFIFYINIRDFEIHVLWLILMEWRFRRHYTNSITPWGIK